MEFNEIPVTWGWFLLRIHLVFYNCNVNTFLKRKEVTPSKDQKIHNGTFSHCAINIFMIGRQLYFDLLSI